MPTYRLIETAGLTFIEPIWPVPSRIQARVTTRLGGVSAPPFQTLNLATHVGDSVEAVNANRDRLAQVLQWSRLPRWLSQQHTTTTLAWQGDDYDTPPVADAIWTDLPEAVCPVMTADCLPILISDRQGRFVSAVHAGWRGLLNGILAENLAHLPSPAHQLVAWIGPAISAAYFEVGTEVYDGFCAVSSENEPYFAPSLRDGKWWADLPGLAEAALRRLGVCEVVQSGLCSYAREDWFYSYRRDGQTGRMASLIWLSDT